MDTLVLSQATLKTPAYAAASVKAPLAPWSIERREPDPHDVLIDILFCGVCHERMLKNDVRYRFVIDLASLKSGAP